MRVCAYAWDVACSELRVSHNVETISRRVEATY